MARWVRPDQFHAASERQLVREAVSALTTQHSTHGIPSIRSHQPVQQQVVRSRACRCRAHSDLVGLHLEERRYHRPHAMGLWIGTVSGPGGEEGWIEEGIANGCVVGACVAVRVYHSNEGGASFAAAMARRTLVVTPTALSPCRRGVCVCTGRKAGQEIVALLLLALKL